MRLFLWNIDCYSIIFLIIDYSTIIQLHCPQEGYKTNSLYKFRNYSSISKGSRTKKHFYCPRCLRELQRENDICPSCPQQRPSYFVELPAIQHLKEMYKRYLVHRRRTGLQVIEDLCMGAVFNN